MIRQWRYSAQQCRYELWVLIAASHREGSVVDVTVFMRRVGWVSEDAVLEHGEWGARALLEFEYRARGHIWNQRNTHELRAYQKEIGWPDKIPRTTKRTRATTSIPTTPTAGGNAQAPAAR